MSRQPINLEFKGFKTPRERVWDAIIELSKTAEFFDKCEVRSLCRPIVKLGLVSDYMDALGKAGYLQKTAATPTGYRLIKPQGVAPRVNATGAKVHQGAGTEAMWRSMKVLATFDYTDIARAATLGTLEVKPSTAKHYVLHLARAGYLSVVRKATPGTPAKHRLTNNTGMHAPAITRMKVVFDRNTGQFANLQTAQEVCDGLE